MLMREGNPYVIGSLVTQYRYISKHTVWSVLDITGGSKEERRRN